MSENYTRLRDQRTPISSNELNMHLSGTKGFDRYVLRVGFLMQVTGGTTLKAMPKSKTQTATDAAISYLQRSRSTNFESGFSAAEIAKATHYSRGMMSDALGNLVDKKILASERIKNRVKYYFTGQHQPTPEP